MAGPFDAGKKEEKKDTSMAEVAAASAAAAAKAVMEEALPAMVAALKASQPGAAGPVKVPDTGPKCHVCLQSLKACGGKHVNMAVYPTRYPEFGQWFQGVRINGVCYISNDAGHKIPVPEAAASDIKSMVQNYEESERVARMGRSVTPSANRITVDSSVASDYR